LEDDVLKTVRKLTNKKGVDVALECSGMEEAQVQCLEAVKPWGRVAFLGIKAETTKFNILQHFILKDITVIGSWAMKPAMHSEIINITRRGLCMEDIITHRFKIEEAASAFETFFGGKGVKVMINPWD
jgi:threonine dehydrogenase-like Zn-dependent dehydrogenase